MRDCSGRCTFSRGSVASVACREVVHGFICSEITRSRIRSTSYSNVNPRTQDETTKKNSSNVRDHKEKELLYGSSGKGTQENNRSVFVRICLYVCECVGVAVVVPPGDVSHCSPSDAKTHRLPRTISWGTPPLAALAVGARWACSDAQPFSSSSLHTRAHAHTHNAKQRRM